MKMVEEFSNRKIRLCRKGIVELQADRNYLKTTRFQYFLMPVDEFLAFAEQVKKDRAEKFDEKGEVVE